MFRTLEMAVAGAVSVALLFGSGKPAEAAPIRKIEEVNNKAGEGEKNIFIRGVWQGYNECGIAALQMASDAVGMNISKANIISVAQRVGVGSFDPTTVTNPVAFSPEALVATARIFGLVVESGENKNWGDLYNWLSSGAVPIVDVRVGYGSFGHFMPVSGMNLNKETITFNDSLRGGARVTYTRAQFEAMWRNVDIGDPLKPDASGHVNWAMVVRSPSGSAARDLDFVTQIPNNAVEKKSLAVSQVAADKSFDTRVGMTLTRFKFE